MVKKLCWVVVGTRRNQWLDVLDITKRCSSQSGRIHQYPTLETKKLLLITDL